MKSGSTSGAVSAQNVCVNMVLGKHAVASRVTLLSQGLLLFFLVKGKLGSE